MLRLRFLPLSLELPDELPELLDVELEEELDLELLPLLVDDEPELLSEELRSRDSRGFVHTISGRFITVLLLKFTRSYLLPLLDDEAARFFLSLSLPLSLLFSLSVASESLLPVLSLRLRALRPHENTRQ